MDAATETAQADAAHLNDFGKATVQFLKYGQRFSNNLQSAFEDMGPKEWLRLVIIAGGYMLFRTQIMRWLGRRQLDEMEKQDAKEKVAKISPNELRGAKAPGDELDDLDNEDAQATSADWGSKARTRQRLMLKQLMEAEERRKQEEDDDKDIADLLED
ncbi:Protein trafficking PGA2 [Geosmithia morbida]|uniref:Protein trafficking PGA2 n=1 Tax=Geosmithia morbida TaxID=1094350 RepID=A0A9P4YNH3_9HYPO|nr:Protein trafficking PGA2 [Geosmithia morbida]KAF4119697.1 Protein trafficking PGA2 [Geosmithia morbida]